MINTLSNTLEAQEKTQDIKQSPSMKIGTKQDVISVQSVAEKRDFVPNGYFLSGAYKYNPQPAIWLVWS